MGPSLSSKVGITISLPRTVTSIGRTLLLSPGSVSLSAAARLLGIYDVVFLNCRSFNRSTYITHLESTVDDQHQQNFGKLWKPKYPQDVFISNRR